MQRMVLKHQRKKNTKTIPVVDPLSAMLENPSHRESCHLPHDGTPSVASRTFPVEEYATSRVKYEDIEASYGKWVYFSCPQSASKCPHCRNHIFHVGCLVVSISGALSTTSVQPRSSIGVYFGRRNRNNIAVKLDGEKHTAQTAELKACLEALTRVLVIHGDWQNKPPKSEACHPLHTVVIKSDAKFLIKGATEWLPKWKENGWKRNGDQPLANVELWRILDAVLEKLEAHIHVQFWLVPREMNQIATKMAKNVI